MAENTTIEWADHTFNPWTGCTKVSHGCDLCYAERWSKRAGAKVGKWGPGMPRVRTTPAIWRQPLKWDAQARAEGRRFRVFCASLADVFDNEVPMQWRRDLFDLIEETPHLDWLLLTKRIGNARRLYANAYLDSARPWPANVWLGATVVTQEEADRDIPKLLAVPAATRFLSIEPLLGPMSLSAIPISGTGHHEFDHIVTANVLKRAEQYPPLPHIDWVIVGGESGHGARPMHPDWVRDLRDQCAAAGVPFMFKQWGEWTPGENVERTRGTVDTAFLHEDGWHIYPLNLATDDGHIDDQPDLYRVGKKAAGRLLDDRTWDEVPA